MYQASLDLAELTDTYIGIRNSDITPTAIYIVSCWHTAKLIIIFTETDKPIAFRLSWLWIPLHLQRYQSIKVTMRAIFSIIIWAMTYDFQQCSILKSVDSDEPVEPPFKLRNSKWCSVSSLTLLECSTNKQRLKSDCGYAQADLRLCWSDIPHCWKSHAVAHIHLN